MFGDGRIIKSRPYGQHISLACRNHPNMRWSTKNIGNIGSRSIFYVGQVGPDGTITQDHFTPECSCSAADLYPVHANEPEVPA